jgi:hypothetical protein
MNLLQEVRSMGLESRVNGDGEIVAAVPQMPDYYAHLSEFNGLVWCEVAESYAGTLVKSGVLPTVAQAVNFAQYHACMFDNALLRLMAEQCEWPRGAQ